MEYCCYRSVRIGSAIFLWSKNELNKKTENCELAINLRIEDLMESRLIFYFTYTARRGYFDFR